MSKTLEELAEEWIEANGWNTEPFRDEYTIEFRKQGYVAGYQAGRSNSEAVQAAASQWISVDKQLPELEIQCIWIDVRCIALNAMAARNVDDCEMWWNNYTHWMPIPKPPEE